MSMSCSLSLSHSQSLSHRLDHAHSDRARSYYHAALKAFRKFQHGGKNFYTCNVERLRECNRLGDQKEVTLWRTHFFLCSPHFDDITGVVFSAGPGEELAALSRTHAGMLFVAHGDHKMINVRSGYTVILDKPLIFASAEALTQNPSG